MGRGSSKAGGGGGLTASLPPVTQTLQPPSLQQVAEGNILPVGGVAYSQFQQMTDDEKADVIDQALQTGVPLFLEDSALQRFAYFTGMSDKPTVVSDDALDKMRGKDIFRTVHDSYSKSTDIGYTSKDICEQIAKGDFTMYSDSGGSAYGKAIYFAGGAGGRSALRSSLNYMAFNGTDTTMRAKITGGKGTSKSAANSAYARALGSGDKLATACSKAGHEGSNLYALASGYTHLIDGSSGYHMILNRSCLSVSSTYKDSASLQRAGKWK